MPVYNDFFGPYGGRYVPEVLQPPLAELEKAFRDAIKDPEFLREWQLFQSEFIGRPTPPPSGAECLKGTGRGLHLY